MKTTRRLAPSGEAPAAKSLRSSGEQAAAGAADLPSPKPEMVMTMCIHLQKLAIQTSQQCRETTGSQLTTAFVPIKTVWAKAMTTAGRLYQESVKGRPGHDLGPPMNHIAMAMVESMLSTLEEMAKVPGNEGALQHHTFLLELAQVLQPKGSEGFQAEKVSDLFNMCKAREILPRKARRDKKDKDIEMKTDGTADNNKADRIIVQMCLNPLCSVELPQSGVWNIAVSLHMHSVLAYLVKAAEGEFCQGGPPPAKAERQVHEDHRALVKRLG